MTEPLPSTAFAGTEIRPKLEGASLSDTIVELADIVVAQGDARFAFIGLGSCIGLCALDPIANIAGAIHIMLPKAVGQAPTDKPGKFVDTGIQELIRLMEAAGANRARIQAAYAGGASVAEFSGQQSKFDIGPRNIEALRDALSSLRLPVMAADEGGTTGRTMRMWSDSGDVVVRTLKQGEAKLCNLRA